MLKVSKNQSLTDIVSTDGSNPITTSHPIEGSSVETKLFLFNDDSTKMYTSVVIAPIDTSGTNESNYITLALDNNGVAGLYTSTLNMANISDMIGHAFWVRVTTPAIAQTQNKTDIKLQINSIEYAK